ncbi:MAG: hypothetical protein KKB31_06345 [Nanoarchaeota archaeon]|nr:hypothetical protein [Nanoarchaeota archaeon]
MIVTSFLERALEQSWCKETSSFPNKWNTGNPALGQCAVTALVVNDYVDGEIVWAQVSVGDESISHYFNLVDGEEVDLTRRQFPEGIIIPKGVPKTNGFKTTRDYILSYPKTVERYELLKKRVLSNF